MKYKGNQRKVLENTAVFPKISDTEVCKKCLQRINLDLKNDLHTCKPSYPELYEMPLKTPGSGKFLNSEPLIKAKQIKTFNLCP